MTQDATLAALVSNIASKLADAEKPTPTPRAEAVARARTLINRLSDDELDNLLIGLENGTLP